MTLTPWVLQSTRSLLSLPLIWITCSIRPRLDMVAS
jgi:hypothetical protein